MSARWTVHLTNASRQASLDLALSVSTVGHSNGRQAGSGDNAGVTGIQLGDSRRIGKAPNREGANNPG